MIIKLPMGVTMDTSNVPNNFGVIIRDSFRKFTDGTKEEYRRWGPTGCGTGYPGR